MEAFAIVLLALACAAFAGRAARKRTQVPVGLEPEIPAACTRCGVARECRRSLSSAMGPGLAHGCPEDAAFVGRAAFPGT